LELENLDLFNPVTPEQYRFRYNAILTKIRTYLVLHQRSKNLVLETENAAAPIQRKTSTRPRPSQIKLSCSWQQKPRPPNRTAPGGRRKARNRTEQRPREKLWFQRGAKPNGAEVLPVLWRGLAQPGEISSWSRIQHNRSPEVPPAPSKEKEKKRQRG
jgi:hypothetical protein